MILCLTPNPAIDRTLYVDRLIPGDVQRARRVTVAAGGKGLNAARAIRSLGGNPLCMGLIGGHGGDLLAELAKQEGLTAQWTRTRNETRTCIILVQANQDAIVINENGIEISLDECKTFLTDAWEQSSYADLVCVSGSLPPGFPLDQFESLLAGFVARGKPVWVDTSGKALKTALGVRGINIKVNAAELGGALDIEISTMEQAAKATDLLRERGISQIAVTLGKDGAVFNMGAGTLAATSPTIKLVSSVGSGDAFLGGFLFALDGGDSPEAALRKAVAAGAANALEIGGGKLLVSEFETLCKKVGISVLS